MFLRKEVAVTPETRGLFDALVLGDAPTAVGLLQGPNTDRMQLQGRVGITSLHCAVAGRCFQALAPLVAAGAPLNDTLVQSTEWWNFEYLHPLVMTERGLEGYQRNLNYLGAVKLGGASPLVLAVCLGQVDSVRLLLELGADPNISSRPALSAFPKPASCGALHRQLLELLLQHGADCLQSTPGDSWCSLMHHKSYEFGGVLLAHLERQRAAGMLQLGSRREALDLAYAAIVRGHSQLLSHSISCLEGMLGADLNVQGDGARELACLLDTALCLSEPSCAATALEALLTSQLPFNLAIGPPRHPTALALASVQEEDGVPEAMIQLLRQAGAPLMLEGLLFAVRCLDPRAVALLLACGRPAVDENRVGLASDSPMYYSCPIHELLRQSTRANNAQDGVDDPALRVLESLLGAGYRPTVYRNVVPPNFLRLDTSHVMPVLDPFDFHPPSLDQRLVFLARGGCWSPDSHHHWPAAFKAAARTLLLASSAAGWQPVGADTEHGAGGGDQTHEPPAESDQRTRGGRLAVLQSNTLLRVLELAAGPMSAWL